MQAIEGIHQTIIAGLKHFFAKSGRSSALIGLSGGLDSALVAALSAEALGKENILGLIMPSQHSTLHSVADAVQLAENLGVTYHIVPIASIYHTFIKELTPVFGPRKAVDTTEENLQARIRGTLLMAVSNKTGYLVLNTSNKSELSMGYGTLYGDLVGAVMVIADLYKTQVYEIARYINRHSEIIPLNTINKAPSAELRPNQKDSDSLPPYDLLDAILYALNEEGCTPEDLWKRGFEKEVIEHIVRQQSQVAFKALQVPPMIKVGNHPLLPENKIVNVRSAM